MGRYRSLMIRGLGLAVFLLVVYYPFLDWQPAERFLKSPGSTFSGAKWAFGLTDETSTEDAVLSLAPNISDISDVVPPTPMPPSAQPPPRTSMGKVTMLFGDRNAAYERAVMTHQYHADIQGYENYVLRAEMIDGIWNKPSYLLFLIMRELKRPPKERLQWLFWYDADTVIINPQIPLEAFVPPAEFDDIHLLYAKDWNGLNAGVFFIRVNWWAAEIMSAVLAYRVYRPEEQLTFHEQTALARALEEDRFKLNATEYPQRWFNAYDAGFLNESIDPHQVRRGDMLVHFAGLGEKQKRANYWSEIAERHMPEWELNITYTSYPGEISVYWDMKKDQEASQRKTLAEAIEDALELADDTAAQIVKFQAKLDPSEQHKIFEKVDDVRSACANPIGKDVVEKAVEELQQTTKKFLNLAIDTRQEIIRHAHEALLASETILSSGVDPKFESIVKDIGEKSARLRDLLMTAAHEETAVEQATMELRGATAVLASLLEGDANQSSGNEPTEFSENLVVTEPPPGLAPPESGSIDSASFESSPLDLGPLELGPLEPGPFDSEPPDAGTPNPQA